MTLFGGKGTNKPPSSFPFWLIAVNPLLLKKFDDVTALAIRNSPMWHLVIFSPMCLFAVVTGFVFDDVTRHLLFLLRFAKIRDGRIPSLPPQTHSVSRILLGSIKLAGMWANFNFHLSYSIWRRVPLPPTFYYNIFWAGNRLRRPEVKFLSIPRFPLFARFLAPSSSAPFVRKTRRALKSTFPHSLFYLRR